MNVTSVSKQATITHSMLEVYERPFNNDAVSISAVFVLLMAAFGVLANLVTIFVVAKSRELKSVFNILIISICVSDLLSSLMSPLFLYRRTWGFDEWLLPGFLCKVIWAVDTWTTYATALHIVLFSVIRLVSIQWTLQYKNIKIMHMKITAGAIWTVAFCCGFVPIWIWYEASTKDRYASTVDAKWPACTLNTEWLQQYKLYYKIAFPIFIYLPMVTVAIMSPTTSLLLLRQRSRRFQRKESMTPTRRRRHSKCEMKTRQRENHVIMQLLFIAGSFMLGYIPITAYSFYTTNVEHSTKAGKIFDWNFGMVAYILLLLSKCLNPIFYNIVSGKMRRETFNFLRSLWRCCLAPVNKVRSGVSSSNSFVSASVDTDLEL